MRKKRREELRRKEKKGKEKLRKDKTREKRNEKKGREKIRRAEKRRERRLLEKETAIKKSTDIRGRRKVAKAVNEIVAANRMARWKDRVQSISEESAGRPAGRWESLQTSLKTAKSLETAVGSLRTVLLLC
jgi:hypothetical protein